MQRTMRRLLVQHLSVSMSKKAPRFDAGEGGVSAHSFTVYKVNSACKSFSYFLC